MLIALFTGTVSLSAPGWSTGAAKRVNCKYMAAIIPFTGTEHSLLSELPMLSPERAAWHPVTWLVMFLIHLSINPGSRGGGGGGSRSLAWRCYCLREAAGGGHRLRGLNPGNVSSKIGAAAWHEDLEKREDLLVARGREGGSALAGVSCAGCGRGLEVPGILGERLCLAPSPAGCTRSCGGLAASIGHCSPRALSRLEPTRYLGLAGHGNAWHHTLFQRGNSTWS